MSKIDNLINELNQKLVIEDVIGSYLDIKKKGTNYWAVCPFHDDTEPSLSISPNKKIFKCFVCGTGGDAIGFVRKFNNISFIEALKNVSQMYSIKYEDYIDVKEIKQTDEQKAIYKINDSALNFFKFQLELEIKKNSKLKNYLKERNLTEEDIEKYQLGFNSQNKVINYLISKKFTFNDIYTAKLGKGDQSILQQRLIFPIINEHGFVEGFSGRVIEKTAINIPKYINSEESEVFKKSNSIWNINNLGYSEKEIILFEGFMDVISWEKYSNSKIKALAIMGTAFDHKLINKLKQRTNQLILGFDNDNAGLQTKIKFANKYLNEINIRILTYDSKYKDVDEFFNSKQSKYELLEYYIWFIDIYLLNIININNIDDYNKLPSDQIRTFLKSYQNHPFYEVVKKYFEEKIQLSKMFLNLVENKNLNLKTDNYNTSNSQNINLNENKEYEKYKIKKSKYLDILNHKEKIFLNWLEKFALIERKKAIDSLKNYIFEDSKLEKEKEVFLKILLNHESYHKLQIKNETLKDIEINESLIKEIENDLLNLKNKIYKIDLLIELINSPDEQISKINFDRLKKMK